MRFGILATPTFVAFRLKLGPTLVRDRCAVRIGVLAERARRGQSVRMPASGGKVPDSAPSRRIVDQRTRNRIIEYFEVAASYDEQATYEVEVPIANVPYEVINQRKDWVPTDPRASVRNLELYTSDEVDSLRQYQAVWERVADPIPDDYPSLNRVQAMPEWALLREAAESSLRVFARRGNLSEDREDGAAGTDSPRCP